MDKSLNIISNIILFLPIALITGPFFSDLIVSVSAIFFLYYCIKTNNFRSFNNNLFKLFLLFWVYIIFTSFFSENIVVSLKVSIPYIRFGLFVLLIAYLINNKKGYLVKFSILTIILYCIVLFDSYFQFIFGFNIFGFVSPVQNRLSSFFADEMVVGSFLSRLFPFILFCILIVSKKFNDKIKYLSPLLLILTDVIIYMSGERTSFAILLIINVGFIILISHMKIIRLITFIISLILITIISYQSTLIKDRMINQTLNDFEYKDGNLKVFSKVHQDHYETAIKMFADSPLKGVGVKMFRYECSKEKFESGKFSCTTHPHHLHLQLLSETGIIGYCFILYLFFFVIRKFIITVKLIYIDKKNDKLNDLKNCILLGVFANLFPLIPSGNFFNNWLSILYFLPIGFYFLKDINDAK